MKLKYLIAFFPLCFFACQDDVVEPEPPVSEVYFPPTSGSDWETTTPESLDWNTATLPDLLTWVEEKNTRAFLILKDGKIVVENYWGETILGQPFDQNSSWYWASAAKTLTSSIIGIQEQEDLLDLNDSSKDYLGAGWSSLNESQENEITILNHLTMTTGLNDGNGNADCTDPDCLIWEASPGERWAYHNAPYTLLTDVISSAAPGGNFDDYFNTKLADPIGMNGYWIYLDYNHLYLSDARSMARFGLMVANQGKWEDLEIINKDYVEAMITPSQDLNKSYGYLWWLNGQSSYMLPGSQFVFSGKITPNAPNDMYAAIGKNGQFLTLVPSKGLVIIRMGESPDEDLVPLVFYNELWEKLGAIIP